MATIADFNNLAQAQLGVPYVFGGVNLAGTAHPGLDCSGLPYAVSLHLGQNIPRTSEAQFAGLPRVADPAQLRRGDLVFYDVPEDTQPQPAHVTIWWSPTQVLQAPRTGEDVMFSAPLPYTVMGYGRLPFPNAAPAPAPIPTEDEMQIVAYDPKTGGYWATDANGANYAGGGAPFIPGLNTHPDYKAGAAESAGQNPCVGISYWAALGNDGVIYFTKPTTGVGGWTGTPYSTYRFLRNGQPA